MSCIQADEDQNDGDKRWEPDSDVESDDDRYPKFALFLSLSVGVPSIEAANNCIFLCCTVSLCQVE